MSYVCLPGRVVSVFSFGTFFEAKCQRCEKLLDPMGWPKWWDQGSRIGGFPLHGGSPKSSILNIFFGDFPERNQAFGIPTLPLQLDSEGSAGKSQAGDISGGHVGNVGNVLGGGARFHSNLKSEIIGLQEKYPLMSSNVAGTSSNYPLVN